MPRSITAIVPAAFCLCSLVIGAAVHSKASQLVNDAKIRQAAYLCDAGYESNCYALARMTEGECSAPNAGAYGCKYDAQFFIGKP